MKRYLLIMCCLMGMMLIGGVSAQAQTKKPKPVEKACVSKIHVIKGCSACEAMMDWLRQAGIKLNLEHVEQGQYRLYPSVVYTDKYVDHGERMYKQEVIIPQTICVISCSVGTN